MNERTQQPTSRVEYGVPRKPRNQRIFATSSSTLVVDVALHCAVVVAGSCPRPLLVVAWASLCVAYSEIVIIRIHLTIYFNYPTFLDIFTWALSTRSPLDTYYRGRCTRVAAGASASRRRSSIQKNSLIRHIPSTAQQPRRQCTRIRRRRRSRLAEVSQSCCGDFLIATPLHWMADGMRPEEPLMMILSCESEDADLGLFSCSETGNGINCDLSWNFV